MGYLNEDTLNNHHESAPSEKTKPEKYHLHRSTSEFIYRVRKEIESARRKFPGNKHQLAALVEEVGELAQALIDHDRGEQTYEDVYNEAIQVAAMAIRVGTEGDESFKYLQK